MHWQRWWWPPEDQLMPGESRYRWDRDVSGDFPNQRLLRLFQRHLTNMNLVVWWTKWVELCCGASGRQRLGVQHVFVKHPSSYISCISIRLWHLFCCIEDRPLPFLLLLWRLFQNQGRATIISVVLFYSFLRLNMFNRKRTRRCIATRESVKEGCVLTNIFSVGFFWLLNVLCILMVGCHQNCFAKALNMVWYYNYIMFE